MKHMRRLRGFTLMELLVSISIIAILMSIGIASYSTINKQSRDTKRKGDIEQIRSALEVFRADNGHYPSQGGGSWVDTATLSTDLVPDYMSAVPEDPKSTSQTYMYKAKNVSGGQYYRYCISAALEAENPDDTCTSETFPAGHNYGLKNP